MRAVVANDFAPVDNLVISEVSSRPVGINEAKVRIHYAGVSFADALMASGKHQFRPQLPFIPGTEFSGQILELGQEVTNLAVGDFVAGTNMGGALAEQIIVPADVVQKLEDDTNLDELSVIRASYFTAWYALKDQGHIQPGETVLVLGAAGAVGIASIQLAKFFGATVIASASTEGKRELALKNGADFAVATHSEDWRSQIKAIVGSSGVNIVVDPVGGAVSEAAFRTLGHKGRHLVVGFASGEIPAIPLNLPLLKSASIIGALASNLANLETEKFIAVCDEVLKLYYQGKIKPIIAEVYPFEGFLSAIKAAEQGNCNGRVLLKVQ